MTAALERLLERARTRFRETWRRAPTLGTAAPGRVNLIGEHTDHDGGRVLPVAIDRWTVALAAPRDDGRVRAVSTGRSGALDLPATGEPPGARAGWGAWLGGVLAAASETGLGAGGLDLLVDATLPVGRGLSSSASLSVTLLTLLGASGGRPPEALEQARLAQDVEHRWLGVPCGIMDPFVVIRAVPGHALRLDCTTLRARPVPLPAGLGLVVVDPGLPHALADGAYAERRREVEAAARALGVERLSLLTPDELVGPNARLPERLARRARHVVGENARVDALTDALLAGDLPAAGDLLWRGHASLRDDFEVSLPALDAVVEQARRLADEGAGVFGARLTGGGFGGCVIVLAEAERAGAVAERLLERLGHRPGPSARAFVTPAVGGARVVEP